MEEKTFTKPAGVVPGNWRYQHMKANNRAMKKVRTDEGVSPVIAVILMVAITVVLAATVYVWVSGFASDESGPENAQMRASGLDEDNDGATDWIKLTLVRGENAPYSNSVTDWEVLNHTSEVVSTTDLVCTSVNTADELCAATADFEDDASDTNWAIGESLFIGCRGDGQHQITVTIRGSTVFDDAVNCDELAA